MIAVSDTLTHPRRKPSRHYDAARFHFHHVAIRSTFGCMASPGKIVKKSKADAMTYPNPESRSADLFTRAQRVLTDGGSRSTIRIAPYSIYVAKAQGKYVTDVDGNDLIDFNYNYTSMIHGHAHPEIIDAAMRQAKRGSGFSFGSEAEFALAELLCDRCEQFDKIRFMNSGTEAVMNAIKAARAYTGKPKIANCRRQSAGCKYAFR